MTMPAVIEQVTQVVGATAADWNSTTDPLPDKVLVIAMDTGDIKRGNGTSLYSELPVLFNAEDVTLFMTLLQDKSDIGHHHVAADIDDLAAILAGKSDTNHTHTLAGLPEVQTAMNDRPTTSTVNAALALKADVTYVNAAVAAVATSAVVTSVYGQTLI